MPERRVSKLSHWSIHLGVAILLTAAFAYWASVVIETEQILTLLESIRPAFVFQLIAFSIVIVLFRWFRLWLLMGCRRGLPLLRASTLHGTAVAFLPAKLGELVLPATLMREFGIKISEAAGLLILVRLYDLLLLFIAGLTAVGLLSATYLTPPMLLPCLIVAAFVATILATLPFLARRIRRAALTLLRGSRRLSAAVDGLTSEAATMSFFQNMKLSCATLLIWASFFGLCHSASLAVGGDWQFGQSVVAGTAGSIAFALPINGLANLGPFEAAFSAALAAGDQKLDAAIGAALLVHLMGAGAAAVSALTVQATSIAIGRFQVNDT